MTRGRVVGAGGIAVAGMMTIGLAGCGTFTTSEAAYDTTAFSVWRQRGEEAGQAMRRYCLSASRQHREWFFTIMTHNAYPAVVTIECPEP